MKTRMDGYHNAERIDPELRYREKSEMLRSMAETEPNGQQRGTLLKIASVYEHLACAIDAMRRYDAPSASRTLRVSRS